MENNSLEDIFGLDGDISMQEFNEISKIILKQGHKLGSVSPIFEKVEESIIKKQKSKLGEIV